MRVCIAWTCLWELATATELNLPSTQPYCFRFDCLWVSPFKQNLRSTQWTGQSVIFFFAKRKLTSSFSFLIFCILHFKQWFNLLTLPDGMLPLEQEVFFTFYIHAINIFMLFKTNIWILLYPMIEIPKNKSTLEYHHKLFLW